MAKTESEVVVARGETQRRRERRRALCGRVAKRNRHPTSFASEQADISPFFFSMNVFSSFDSVV